MKETIAKTLSEAGFQVDDFTNGLLISLKSRKVSTMEVDLILMDELGFEVQGSPVSQGVFIGTVTL